MKHYLVKEDGYAREFAIRGHVAAGGGFPGRPSKKFFDGLDLRRRGIRSDVMMKSKTIVNVFIYYCGAPAILVLSRV